MKLPIARAAVDLPLKQGDGLARLALPSVKKPPDAFLLIFEEAQFSPPFAYQAQSNVHAKSAKGGGRDGRDTVRVFPRAGAEPLHRG